MSPDVESGGDDSEVEPGEGYELRRFLRRKWVIRAALGLYVLSIAGLIGGYIGVATLDLQVSAYIQAPSELQIGRPNAARGIIMNAPTGRLMVGADATFEIIDPETKTSSVLAEAETQSHGHLHTRLRPDASLQPGTYELRLDAQHPRIDEFDVSASVELVEAASSEFEWPQKTTRAAKGKKRRKPTDHEWEGPLRVDVLPRDAEVVRGLPGVIYLRITRRDTGAPVRGTIRLLNTEGISEGLPEEVSTGPLGLAQLSFTPVTNQTWTLLAEAPNPGDIDNPEAYESHGTWAKSDALRGKGKLDIATVPAQFSMRMNDQFVAPGGRLEGSVQSLYRSGGIMVDLYEPDHWVSAAAFGLSPQGGGFRIEVPEDVSSDLYRVQLYQELFGPGGAWDSRYVVRAEGVGVAGCVDGLRRVLGMLKEHGDERDRAYAAAVLSSGVLSSVVSATACNRWVEAMLLAIPRHFEPPPLIINSQKSDRAELETWKSDIQDQLFVVTGFVLFVGLAFVVLLVLQGMARSQRQSRMLTDLEAELAADAGPDEEIDAPRRIDFERWLVALRAVIVLTALITFALALLMLLTYL